jgi:Flp pilus assembly protein TadG
LGFRDAAVSRTAARRAPIWARFWRDRRGVVAIAVALLLPVLIGFAGLGVEVGLWFWVQRQNQSAADAAAISAALEYAAQIERDVAIDSTAATAAATTAANCNLFSTSTSSSNAVCPLPSSASNTITLYPFNTSGSNGTPNAVQVVLTQPLNTTFANLVTAIWGPSVNTVNVTTTAIAAFPQTSACLLALDRAAPGAVLVDNGGALANSSCWVASNSTSGSALACNGCTIAGPTTVGGGDTVFNNGHLNGSPNRTYASVIADPYAATLTHAFLTDGMLGRPTCAPPPSTATTYTYPSSYCIITNGLSFAGTITLLPGTYWVTDGSLNLSGQLQCACSPGAGVTIIFTTTQGSAGTIGTLSPTGPLTITLNAPGPGAVYAGLLMVQDPVAGARSGTISGNPISILSGLIYFPKSNLSLVGNIQTDASNCLVTVAGSLSLTGNINLTASGCQSAGLTTVPAIFSVFLTV